MKIGTYSVTKNIVTYIARRKVWVNAIRRTQRSIDSFVATEATMKRNCPAREI